MSLGSVLEAQPLAARPFKAPLAAGGNLPGTTPPVDHVSREREEYDLATHINGILAEQGGDQSEHAVNEIGRQFGRNVGSRVAFLMEWADEVEAVIEGGGDRADLPRMVDTSI